MPKSEFIKEHQELVKILRSGKGLAKEAREQHEELKQVKKKIRIVKIKKVKRK